jgi:hypothetical protein
VAGVSVFLWGKGCSSLAFWIDGYYRKRERRHSSISCLSPIDYEQQFIDRLN